MTLEQRILEASVDGVFAVDRERRVTLWNRRIAALSGIAASEIHGNNLFAALPEWRSIDAQLARAFAGATCTDEFPVAQCYDATYSPLGNGGGEIDQVVVFVRDSTKFELARQELIESNTRFQIMADTSPVLLWMAATDGLCTFFNARWLAFTGRSLETELGNGWAEGVHPEDFQRCMDTYLGAFVARRPFRMEYRLRRHDGEFRWLLDTGVPRYLPSGAFAGYIGSCIDVTDLTLARANLDRLVRERTAELEAFAYSVSHDLRAPLRGIEGFARALEDHETALDDKGRHYLERIRAGAQHMASLIDGLLQLSRIGRREMQLDRCDLSRLAQEVARALHEAEPQRTTEIEIEDGLIAHGDPQLLRIALDNLIGNAWKFTGRTPGAKIVVGSVERDGDRVYVVRDNGVGFDMAHAGRLFGAFQRLHHQRDFPGTGIGLATVHRIVSRHHGRIWAEAAIDRGAAFYLSLPAQELAAEQMT